MTITLASVVSGDVDDTTVVILGDEDASGTFTAINLSGIVSAVEAHVWRRTDRTDAATLTAAVTDDSAGEVTVTLGSWLENLAPSTDLEYWHLEIQVTFTSGKAQTWQVFRLPVRRQGA